MARREVVLHSALAPDAVAGILRRELGALGSVPAGPAEPQGRNGLRGVVEDHSFRVSKRGDRDNSFAAQFYGELEPEADGTRVVGHFEFPRWIHFMMWAWFAVAVVFGIPVLVLTIAEILKGARPLSGNVWVGLIVPPGLLLYAALLPAIGRYLRRGDERFILYFLEAKLAAGSGGGPSAPEQE